MWHSEYINSSHATNRLQKGSSANSPPTVQVNAPAGGTLVGSLSTLPSRVGCRTTKRRMLPFVRGGRCPWTSEPPIRGPLFKFNAAILSPAHQQVEKEKEKPMRCVVVCTLLTLDDVRPEP